MDNWGLVERIENIGIGIGEIITSLYITSAMISAYHGEPPAIVSAIYTPTFLFLTIDCLARITVNRSFLPLTRLYRRHGLGHDILQYIPDFG